MKVVYFSSSSEFRGWLESKHQKKIELWVGFHKKSSGKPSVTYSEALDQALCFGWIDGVRKSVTADAYTVRFTPRKPRSQWSAVNIARVQKLAGSGLMSPAGLKAFEGAKDQTRKYSYEQRNDAAFRTEEESQFRANQQAWNFFQAQPPWYRRTSTFWAISAKKEETRRKRLATLICDSESNRPIKALARPSASKSVPKRKKKMQ